MLEDQKATTSACSAFEQHRFKVHLCVHCFKLKSAHVEKADSMMESTKILALDDNINKVQENDGKAAKQKYDIPKVIIRNQNNLQKDVKGRGERQAERNNRKRGKERTKDSLSHNAKRDVTSKATKNAVTLNIPCEAERSSGLDNKVSSKHDSTQAGIKGSESSSENGSININVLADKQGIETNGNIYPDNNPSDSELELSGSYSEQFRRVLRPVQKAGSPSKTRDRNRRDPELPEFVKVAKNLRHIQSMGLTSPAEVHSSNNNNHSVIETEEMLPDLPDLPNVVGSDASADEQQKLVDSKSNLPNFVMNSQAPITGHETFPKTIGGKSRPSIKPLTKHKRQTSDPEVFMPPVNEEIMVNVSTCTGENTNDVQTENVVVRSSQLSSDVYFGKSPVTSPQKHAGSDAQQDLTSRYGHIADCVTIISQSGEVSHHYERDRGDNGNEEMAEESVASPTVKTDPYRVVDLHDKQEKRKSSSALSSEGTSSSSGRMSNELDEGLGLIQQEDGGAGTSMDPSGHFSRRNVALADGIYTASQFHTDSGINDSMESSDSSDAPKHETPPTQSSKRNTPPYPIILHDEQPPDNNRKKKRNSGQYKVPIFIMPKGYNSSDLDASKTGKDADIDGRVELGPSQSIDYLQPTEKNSEKQTFTTREKNAKKEGAQNLLESKRVSLSDETLQESRRPSRSRSKTHPVLEEELSNGSSGKDQDIPEFSRTRLKRVAPRPPSMEFVEQDFVRERDDRLDSLPHRSPPSPPQKHKKDKKQSIDRSSSDLSDDIDRSSHLLASNNDKSKVETCISGSSGKGDEVRREMSPTRHRDMSPIRNQHESRKATQAKKESHFRARLREFSPTGRRELSPMSREKLKDVSNKENRPSVPHMRRMASPPPPLNRPQPLNLPNTAATQDAPAVTTKSKRSKLPWKRKKKRNDSGSPEREFNAEEVEKWLVSSFSASASPPAGTDPNPANPRNSLERLEVINAYKGEPTVAIKRASQATTNAASPATPNTKETTPNAATNLNRNSYVESEDDDVTRSGGKRKAPKPPTPLPDHQDEGPSEDPVPLQKSYSLSPSSRRKNNETNRTEDEKHLYENMGTGRANIAPQKPARRRQRNRTTGFEDLPSRVKRMAPKTPDKPTPDADTEDDVVQATSAKQLLFEDIPLSSSQPLKSALRSTQSEPLRVDADGKVVPKRPVRIIAPEDESIDTQFPLPSVLRSDYKNLALVPQADLDGKVLKDAGTQVEDSSQRSKTSFADADAQCSLNSHNSSSLNQPSLGNLLHDVDAVHLQALTQLSRTIPTISLDWAGCRDSVWKERITSTDPKCRSAGAAFFDVTHPTSSSTSPGLLVCCDPSKTTQVLQMAELTKSMTSQPNLISVSHATRDTVTIDSSLLEQRKTRGSSPQSGASIETALVFVDDLPKGNVAEYVSQNIEKHANLPEVYERDVASMLLQLCQGLCQLQSRHMCLESLKLDHLLLTESGLPGKGHRLVINHLMGAEVVSPTRADEKEVASKLEQKCHEFDVGILVYEFLHQPNPFSTRTSLIISDYTADDLPDIPVKSSLSADLRTIAAKLLAKNPQDRITCHQAAALLQCLLWGPPSTVFTDNASTAEALNQELEKWLMTEQAKVVTKIALYSLLGQTSVENKSGLTLSDQLQCQYLSDLTVDSCKEMCRILHGEAPSDTVNVIDSNLEL
ncbi:inactive tyrosine-protein kinase PEAK1-like [Lytechinus pictus]|uniref:inactive tyrosine-protein kinase PEAK1-like n=1 Tax=Lytechinus pictus TaxID=7653 RepID=UPI0030B9E914